MNKGIFKSISLVVRYDSYHIGGCTKVRDILLPLTSVLIHTMFPMFPMVDINIRLALLHLRVICRSVSESGGTR